MSLALLDPYHDHSSLIHHSDARIKVLFALGYIVIVNLTSVTSWPAHVAYLSVTLTLIGLARLKLVSVIGRSLLILPFVLIASVGLPFVREGTVIASVPVPWGSLSVTDVGALRFANVMSKAWLSLLMSVTLVFTTRFLDIARGLRALGLPAILTSTLLLMYRYLFVLVDEAQRLMRAREARSVAAPDGRSGGTLIWRARVTGSMIGTLFLRTYERSERIYSAMLARGYTGEMRALGERQIRPREYAASGLGLLALCSVAVLFSFYW